MQVLKQVRLHRQRRFARMVVEKEEAKGEILEVHLVSHQVDIRILQEHLTRCPGLGTKRAGFEMTFHLGF